jgi:hypothetical protein
LSRVNRSKGECDIVPWELLQRPRRASLAQE